ncbi:MAG: diguanylate cyclase [Myxococcaceae bacterium]
MEFPPVPPDEARRLETLRAYEVLDTGTERAFERITALAAALFEVPIALVSLIDEQRQWFKSAHGLAVPQTPRDISFCGHAIHHSEPMVVTDARQDPRFADNPLVTGDPHIQFYAGAPLTAPNGQKIGTLCLIDRKPRALSAAQTQVLADLAALVVDELELRAARRAKQREAEGFRSLLSNMPIAVVVVQDGLFRLANPSAEALFGHPANTLLGTPYLDVIVPEEREASTVVARDALKRPIPVHRRVRRSDGEVRVVEGIASRVTWGDAPATVVAMRDVTDEVRTRREEALVAGRKSAQLSLFEGVFDVLPEGIALFDEKFRCQFANRALGQMLALEPSAFLGWGPREVLQHVSTLSEPDARLPDHQAMQQVSKGAPGATVFHLYRPYRRVLRRTLHQVDVATHPYVAVWNDITHDAEQLQRREEEAASDLLTGLPNRRGIEPKLSRLLAKGSKVSVALFDIDHFKKVNDTFGHATGDEVLKAVGKALAGAARGDDFVGRWGGEEFIALLNTGVDGARIFAERARLAVAALDTAAGPVTLSAGVAESGTHPDVVQAADAKLYEAKHGGRNRVCS